jgi:hypothetical protein
VWSGRWGMSQNWGQHTKVLGMPAWSLRGDRHVGNDKHRVDETSAQTKASTWYSAIVRLRTSPVVRSMTGPKRKMAGWQQWLGGKQLEQPADRYELKEPMQGTSHLTASFRQRASGPASSALLTSFRA